MSPKTQAMMAMRAELAAKVAPRYSAGPYFTNRAMRRAGTPSLVGLSPRSNEAIG